LDEDRPDAVEVFPDRIISDLDHAPVSQRNRFLSCGIYRYDDGEDDRYAPAKQKREIIQGWYSISSASERRVVRSSTRQAQTNVMRASRNRHAQGTSAASGATAKCCESSIIIGIDADLADVNARSNRFRSVSKNCPKIEAAIS